MRCQGVASGRRHHHEAVRRCAAASARIAARGGTGMDERPHLRRAPVAAERRPRPCQEPVVRGRASSSVASRYEATAVLAAGQAARPGLSAQSPRRRRDRRRRGSSRSRSSRQSAISRIGARNRAVDERRDRARRCAVARARQCGPPAARRCRGTTNTTGSERSGHRHHQHGHHADAVGMADQRAREEGVDEGGDVRAQDVGAPRSRAGRSPCAARGTSSESETDTDRVSAVTRQADDEHGPGPIGRRGRPASTGLSLRVQVGQQPVDEPEGPQQAADARRGRGATRGR